MFHVATLISVAITLLNAYFAVNRHVLTFYDGFIHRVSRRFQRFVRRVFQMLRNVYSSRFLRLIIAAATAPSAAVTPAPPAADEQPAAPAISFISGFSPSNTGAD